jgi:hypothetical protein
MVKAMRFRLMEPPPSRDMIVPGRGGGPEEEPGKSQTRVRGTP